MRKDLPIYEISIDLDNDETTLEKNSLVFDPAHEKAFQTFSKVQRWQFNDEERIVIGVAISADTPIYRNLQGEECYVVFTKQAIKAMVYDYARRGNFNKVNVEHETDVNGLSMVYSYQIDKDKGLTAPERFKDENDGSWIVGYKVANDEMWAKVKDGEFRGFSVEGVFEIGESLYSRMLEELKSVKEYINFYNDYPQSVSNNAKRGIELNEKNGNKCATQVGKVRAQQLANREKISLQTIRRMYSYLSRAEAYYDESDTTACGTISFLLWGGLSAKRWAESKLKEEGII